MSRSKIQDPESIAMEIFDEDTTIDACFVSWRSSACTHTRHAKDDFKPLVESGPEHTSSRMKAGPTSLNTFAVVQLVISIYCLPRLQQVQSFRSALINSSREEGYLSNTQLHSMKGSVYIATSLDGYIATKEGSTSWLDELPPPEEGNDMGFGAFMASVDVMIMGRNTFEKVIGFGKDMWPYGDTKLVVWSRGEVEIPDYRQDTVSCSSMSPPDLLAKLEKEGFTRAYIDGGITVQKFLEAGLVTDMCLSRAPLLLGSGIPLFAPDARPVKLKHLETKSAQNGIVSSTYEVIKDAA